MGVSQFRTAMAWQHVDSPEEVHPWFLRDNPGMTLYVATILAHRLDSLNRYLVDAKSQFEGFDDHVHMLDEVLDTLMTKHPRCIERRPVDDQQ